MTLEFIFYASLVFWITGIVVQIVTGIIAEALS